jgi:hypothetical protein
MAETVSNDRPHVAKAVSRPRSRKPPTVSASSLAHHLDLTRQRVSVLADEHVLERLPAGKFDVDASRVAYIRFLRRERQKSPRSQADLEHVAAKAALLRLRIAEKQRGLVPIEDFDAMIDDLCGLVLTSLSGLSARCSRDPVVRRNIDLAVHQIRREMAEAGTAMADACGEPPLSQQD